MWNKDLKFESEEQKTPLDYAKSLSTSLETLQQCIRFSIGREASQSLDNIAEKIEQITEDKFAQLLRETEEDFPKDGSDLHFKNKELFVKTLPSVKEDFISRLKTEFGCMNKKIPSVFETNRQIIVN